MPSLTAKAKWSDRTECIRHQCRKNCLKLPLMCLINIGVEKMNSIKIKIRTLTTRCLKERVNVGIQTIVSIFKVCCSIKSGGKRKHFLREVTLIKV